MNEEIKHYGVPGMKWGVRRAAKRASKQEKKTTKIIQKAIKKQNRIADAWEDYGNSRYANANRYAVSKLIKELENVKVSDIKTRKDVEEFVNSKAAVYLNSSMD